MKRLTVIFLSFLCLAMSASQTPAPEKTPQVIYIEQFATLAVEEMYRSGIPASITLAQGLLESGYGLSELAVKGNNHFGIKCHNNWTGGRMYYDDDNIRVLKSHIVTIPTFFVTVTDISFFLIIR